MKPVYTVTIAQGTEPNDDIVATFYRDTVKIALAFRHNALMSEIALWILEGTMPANGTFYRF